MCNIDDDSNDNGYDEDDYEALDDSYTDYGADVDYMVNSEPDSDLYNEMVSDE